MGNEWESRWGCVNSKWVTTEGGWEGEGGSDSCSHCRSKVDGWIQTGELMEGFRTGYWGSSVGSLKRCGVGVGLLSFFKPLSTCHLSSLSPVLCLPPSFCSPALCLIIFCSKSKCSPLLFAAPFPVLAVRSLPNINLGCV